MNSRGIPARALVGDSRALAENTLATKKPVWHEARRGKRKVNGVCYRMTEVVTFD